MTGRGRASGPPGAGDEPPGTDAPSGTDGGRGPADATPGTRERILTCALRSFATRGFAATNVVDIEEAAGLSPGSGGFYRHFRNKEDVLRAAVVGEIERVRQFQTDRRDDEHAPVGRAALGDRFGRYLAELEQQQDLILVLARDAREIPDLIPTVLGVMGGSGVGLVSDDLAQDMPGPAATDRDPHVVATIVLASALGYSLARMFFGVRLGGVTDTDFAEGLADLVLGTASG